MIPPQRTATATAEPVPAWRAEFHAPVASFRDPLFPGVTRGLPVPPPSTVRGMLAAATGESLEPVVLGMAAWSEGSGVDTETYHPIAADGTNPSSGGRVRAVKGGMTIRDRSFLVDVHLTVWLPEPDGERIAQALRRPRWPLRLGRSQDVVHLEALRRVELQPAATAVVDHALAPRDGHAVGAAFDYRMATQVSLDRLTTAWSDYLWCDEPTGEQPVSGALRDPDGGRAVWLLAP
ncbi:CRISPR-associated protein Cas5 [Actinacidiphila sp. DG2A-62]|uniref:CRISPR-associated protein Cas5 n=1 Tax=Actinacidiphila sp. DG2A-62 TaxID=3108821 RepID=UPI002DBB5C74|nr:CRISPR-associated protein Cas5 [Actinacidiphila sp. DG2A-62]MEC3996094.1 CRISPR-associated protein Cas5 [Actinacidiphila sp. DG2A-62]